MSDASDKNPLNEAAVGPKSLTESLRHIGFAAERRQGWTLWTWQNQKNEQKAPTNLRSPWQIEHCELAERKNGLGLRQLELSLDREQLCHNLTRLCRKYYGVRTDLEIAFGTQGEFWCLFEFTRPGARVTPEAKVSPRTSLDGDGAQNVLSAATMAYGIAGFSVRLRANGQQFELIVADQFGIGYVPLAFASASYRYLQEALALETALYSAVQNNLYELSMPVMAPLLSGLQDLTTPTTARRARVGVMTPNLAVVTIAGALLQSKQALHSYFDCRTEVSSDAQDFWRLLATSETNLAWQGGSSSVPMEVLEARERSGRYGEVDRLIVAGKYNRALSLTARLSEKDPRSLYLLRRVAFLALLGRRSSVNSESQATPDIQDSLRQDPDSKLLLSFGVVLALDAGDNSRLLSLLSRLGEQLMATIPSAENLHCFDMVLPELLGDAWSSENRSKAVACYERVLEKRGEIPRVLRKLIALAQKNNDVAAEKDYLERLAKVERRRGELANIFVRLAELHSGLRVDGTLPTAHGLQDAIYWCMEALKNNRLHVGAVTRLADLLVEDGRAEEAIQNLDQLLREGGSSLAIKLRGKIEGKIAKIWYRDLGRADLAETRYEHALSLDRDNVEAMRDLEAIYRKNGRLEAMIGLLEAQFSLLEERGDADSLRFVFDELVTLYRGVLAQPRRALELYQRLIGSFMIEPEEIDRILAWRDIEIDWHDLYTKLAMRLSTLPSGIRRAQYLCRLGEICRDKLGDTKMALRHLMDALGDGWIDPEGFQFVASSLAAARDYAILARCYEQRISQIPEAEQTQLIMELLALPQVLPDNRRDLLALRVMLLDPKAEQALQQRFRHYQKQNDLDGIARLLEQLISEKRLSSIKKNNWLRIGIEVMSLCADERRFNVMDLTFKRLLATDEDQVGICRDAIEMLKFGRDPRALVDYMVRLLRAGVLPAVDEQITPKLLMGHERELALYHQMMSLKATTKEAASSHAHQAALLYQRFGDERANAEKMLARQGSLVPCSVAEIQELERLVVQSGNWELLAKVLQKQAEFAEDPAPRCRLLLQLGSVFREHIRDVAKARAVYQLCLKYSDEQTSIKLILASLAEEARDDKAERKIWLELLKMPLTSAIFTSEWPSVPLGIGRLIALGDDPRAVEKLIRNRIDEATEQARQDPSRHELAAKFCDALLAHDIVSLDLYRTAFRGAVLSRDDGRAVDLWRRGFACLTSVTQAKDYMGETKRWLDKEQRLDLLLRCFESAVVEHAVEQLPPSHYHEVLLQYGAQLFDADEHREKALAVYQEAYRADDEDQRAWMPLYFLMSEFTSKAERFKYLKELIPKLEKDARPLKSFPITIESLKAELVELRLDSQAAKKTSAALEKADKDKAVVAPSQPVLKLSRSERVDQEAEALAHEVDDEEDEEDEEDVAGVSENVAENDGQEDSINTTAAVPEPAAIESDNPFVVNDLPYDLPADFGGEQLPSEPQEQRYQIPLDAAAGDAIGFSLADNSDDVASPVEPGGTDIKALSGPSNPFKLDMGNLFQPAEDAALPPLPPVSALSDMPAFTPVVPAEAHETTQSRAPILKGGHLKLAPLSVEEREQGEEHEQAPVEIKLEKGSSDDAIDDSSGDAVDEKPTHKEESFADLFALSTIEESPAESTTGSMNPSLGDDFQLSLDVPLSLGLANESELSQGEGDESSDALPLFSLDQAIESKEPTEAPAISEETPHIDLSLGDLSTDESTPEVEPASELEISLDVPRESQGEAPLFELAMLQQGEGEALNLEELEPKSAGAAEIAALTFQVTPATSESGLNALKKLTTGMTVPGILESLESVESFELLEALGTPLGPPGSEASQASASYPSLASGDDLTILGGGTGHSESNASHRMTGKYALENDQNDDVSDWRASVLKGELAPDLMGRLLTQAFANEIEKHVAIQVVALISGQCEQLNTWHWRVWRKPSEYGYPVSGKDRYPNGLSPVALSSSLFKLVLSMAPVFVRTHRQRFSAEYLAKRLQVPPAAIEKMRKPLSWEEGILAGVGFHLFASRIAERRYIAYNLPGLGKEIFYEGSTRALYLDEAYYRKAPPSHLFHRVLGTLWSVRLHYFVPLALDPRRHVLPVMAALNEHFSLHGFSRIKNIVSGRSKMAKTLEGIDTRQMRYLCEKIGVPTEEVLTQLWDAMRSQVLRLLIAETLDIVGIFESITDKDLLKPGALKRDEIYKRSAFARSLIEFITKLQV